MKILFVSQFHKFAKNGGGEAIITFQQAKALVDNEHTVAMLTHGETDTTFFDQDMGLTFIHAHTRGEAPFGYMPLTRNQFAYIEAAILKFNPDVIHAHTMSYLAVLAQGIALKHNYRFLYTTHELPDRLVEFFRFGKWLQQASSVFVHLLVKAFLVNTDKVLAINQASKQSTLNLAYRGQIDVVHNGVEIELYQNIPTVYPDDKIMLFFIGQISERKNQEFLVRVLACLPMEFHLVLIGSCDQSYLRKLKARAKNLGVSDRVTYAGQIPNQELPSVLAGYHCFVSASKTEVQSVAVIEALAAAKPVVALENETIIELTNSLSVIALPKTAQPQAFANAVATMLQNQTQYSERAVAAREISQQYSKNLAYQNNLKAYKSTVLSEFRNPWAYRIPMMVYIIVVRGLYRIKQVFHLCGLWKS
jgi:glycosyltransferase involved in cell wall biosynthesis